MLDPFAHNRELIEKICFQGHYCIFMVLDTLQNTKSAIFPKIKMLFQIITFQLGYTDVLLNLTYWMSRRSHSFRCEWSPKLPALTQWVQAARGNPWREPLVDRRMKVHKAPHPSGCYQGRISLIQQLPPFTFNLSALLRLIALVIHRRTSNHAIWRGN